MVKKVTTIYQTKWRRKLLVSFAGYVRDFFINVCIPVPLPESFQKIFYGDNVQFAFYVHPRRPEDIFVALPFLSFLKYLIPGNIFARVFSAFPPFVLEKVKCENGMSGVVISSVALPEWLLRNRRGAIREGVRGLQFANKIMKGKFFGLGGLWPMVTRRGLALRRYGKKMGKVITNGHCGTALSIYLTVGKIAQICEIPLDGMSIAIIGAGKMGTNLARVFAPQIGRLTLIDISDSRLRLVKEDLLEKHPALSVETLNSKTCPHMVPHALAKSHVAVCTTSNVSAILKPVSIPNNFIIIDDSRPEAIPRVLDGNSKVVLEGGLMKIRGIKLNYDYGFGLDENVFGCFAETYLLALDVGRTLRPTLGEVSGENFRNMREFCDKNHIEVGSFMSSSERILADRIRRIVRERHALIFPDLIKERDV